MWTISKAFEFNYGHRVWNQELNEKFSLSNECKCRYLHGHTATIEVSLSGDTLDRGMITDFNHLNWLKDWIAENIDHKFIMDKNDPMAYTMFKMKPEKVGEPVNPVPLIQDEERTGYVFHSKIALLKRQDTSQLTQEYEDSIKEYYDSMFFVDFSPTSENLAKWIFDFVKRKMKPLNVKVEQVSWKESPKTVAIYKE